MEPKGRAWASVWDCFDFYRSRDVNWAINSRLAYVFGGPFDCPQSNAILLGASVRGSACFVLGRLMLVDFRGVWICGLDLWICASFAGDNKML